MKVKFTVLQSFLSAMLVACGSYYAHRIEVFEKELHKFMLFGVQCGYLIKRKDCPP